jgi:G protein beta subunit-like protein
MPHIAVILATAGYDHRIRYWDANTGACTRVVKFDESQVNTLQISPNKHFLAAAGNPNIHLFDVNSPSDNPLIVFEGHSTNVTSMGFQRDTQWLFSGSEDGTIKIWDLRAPDAQRTFTCRSSVHTAVLHPNQVTILSGDQTGSMKTWDIRAGDKFGTDTVISSDCPLRSLSIVSISLIDNLSFINTLVLVI